jgi:homoserine kinase type II
LAGEVHRRIPDDLLSAAAELLGRIHDVDARELDVPIGLRRLSAMHRDMLLDFPNQDHAEWVRARLERVDRYFPPVDDPRRGRWSAIHGDFSATNVVVGPEREISVIDWETATIDDPMLDCGMSGLSMFVSDGRVDHDRLHLFVDGYEKSGRTVDHEMLMAGVEYAAVIVAFHRYRRHNIRFPNAARKDYYRQMVDFVEQEFPDR